MHSILSYQLHVNKNTSQVLKHHIFLALINIHINIY